jgi:hypothetical protein
MAEPKSFKVRLTKNHNDKLEQQANYLGTTRTNLMLLKIYLKRSTLLSEGYLSKAINSIKKDPDSHLLTVSKFPEYHKEMMKEKKRYFYSTNQYLSAMVYYILEHEDEEQWLESPLKMQKTIRKYDINNELNDKFTTFSKQSGVSKSLLINYAFMVGAEETRFNLSEYQEDRIEVGIEFTVPNVEKLDEYEPAEREYIMNKVIGDIPEQM